MGNSEIVNSGNNGVKPKLLITEDDFENQKFLELFLKRYFEVDVCDSSDTFYNFLKIKNYDVILMDISIRGKKNGLELTTELKNNPEYSSIPVVCYTAHAFNRDRVNAFNAGCDAYLSKPSDIRTLLNSLFDMLKKTKKDFSFDHPLPNLTFANA
ncbi:MAG TPA: response regulator [Melioribacteraceae bacterium]|nr:response regulator [Melioribacteraceae bacterium]